MSIVTTTFLDVPALELSEERAGNVAYFKVSGVPRFSIIRLVGNMVVTVFNNGVRYLLKGQLPMKTVKYEGQTLTEDALFEVWHLEPRVVTLGARLQLSPFYVNGCCPAGGPVMALSMHKESVCAPEGFCNEWCAGDEPQVEPDPEPDLPVYDPDNPIGVDEPEGGCPDKEYVLSAYAFTGGDFNPNEEIPLEVIQCAVATFQAEYPTLINYGWVFDGSPGTRFDMYQRYDRIQLFDLTCDSFDPILNVSVSFGSVWRLAGWRCI
jgi:hypothetical protein